MENRKRKTRLVERETLRDEQGYGWAISKALAQAGAKVILGTWVPALGIFQKSLEKGKFDESRKLQDGSLMEFAKIYPLDAVYDSPEDVPEDVKNNKRYAAAEEGFTVKEVAEQVERDFGGVDILVHSLANGPEVSKPLLETSRDGYLAAVSASTYSFVSMVQRFGPIMPPGSAALCLTYQASERAIPGYGGGMSSAKVRPLLTRCRSSPLFLGMRGWLAGGPGGGHKDAGT